MKQIEKNHMIKNTLLNIIMLSVGIIMVIPLVLVLSTSFSTENDINNFGYSFIPKTFTLDAYKYIFYQADSLLNAYLVTIFVTVTGTVLSLLLVTMFAYPLSRKDFVLKNQLSFYVFFTMLFSGGVIPTYIVTTHFLHLRDSLFALIFPYLISPFNLILIRSYFSEIPDSIIESAKIDGASEYRIFFGIVIPVSLPGVATIALFTILTYWNDWFQALLYIDSISKYPLQYLLQKIMSTIDFIKTSSNPTVRALTLPRESAKMAMCILAIGPIIFVYPFIQKYFIKGLTVGAVKG